MARKKQKNKKENNDKSKTSKTEQNNRCFFYEKCRSILESEEEKYDHICSRCKKTRLYR